MTSKADRQAGRQAGGHPDVILTNKWFERQIDRQRDMWKNKILDEQFDRKADRKTVRQTDGWREKKTGEIT